MVKLKAVQIGEKNTPSAEDASIAPSLTLKVLG